jgi:hypothetical protein
MRTTPQIRNPQSAIRNMGGGMASEESSAATAAPPHHQKRLWSPVRAQAADSFWILMIIAVSITVIVTRVSLELTGYPQLGDDTFHIAHVLWGGLAMFVALVLPLTFANPYIPWITATLGGIGAGLFIDEVGKFITQRNDYFFPLAFPIIYAFVVLCVWFALRLRARRVRDTRTLLYHALEEMKEVLDNDLDPFEHAELKGELAYVLRTTTDTEERALAEALLGFVENRTVQLAQSPTLIERAWIRTRAAASRVPPRIILRAILIVGFGYTALNALFEIVAFVALATAGGRQAITDALGYAVIVSGKSEYLVSDPYLSALHALAIVIAGLLALLAAILLATGRERLGLRFGSASLLISLLIVNLLSFYFNQLYALLATLGQTTLLLVATLYRWRFVRNVNFAFSDHALSSPLSTPPA